MAALTPGHERAGQTIHGEKTDHEVAGQNRRNLRLS